jgi:hypothetical protein
MNIGGLDFRHEYALIIKESEKHSIEPIKEINYLPTCEKKLWKRYKKAVWKITEKQNLNKLLNYEKRAFTGYHLDHKVSIWYGFKNKIDPKLIGSIDNLEFIPHKDNMLKGRKSNFKNTRAIQTVIFL